MAKKTIVNKPVAKKVVAAKAQAKKATVVKPSLQKAVTPIEKPAAASVKAARPRSLKLQTKILTAEGRQRKMAKHIASPRVKVEN